ncbi:MAG TPA: Hsp20/alpha crystallin family protein [Steroidobacteraceae bacterium]|nr:Hsp20/alpha crystallin family protein [Steroidobacteraceae bacterium]
MATNSEVTRRGPSATAAAQSGRVSSGETPVRPPVDIWEDKDGITLCADMPGVSKDRLELRIDGNNLIIEGQVQLELSGKAEALYADIRSSLYRRTFSLSGELETGKIEASLKDGVLTVHIPKRAELRPRKIDVAT